MVRPTSAADINSRASPAAPMRDPDLLLRLSGRIVKGCRLRGSVALRADATTNRAAWRLGPSLLLSHAPHWPLGWCLPAMESSSDGDTGLWVVNLAIEPWAFGVNRGRWP